jgi:hypothetical protein
MSVVEHRKTLVNKVKKTEGRGKWNHCQMRVHIVFIKSAIVTRAPLVISLLRNTQSWSFQGVKNWMSLFHTMGGNILQIAPYKLFTRPYVKACVYLAQIGYSCQLYSGGVVNWVEKNDCIIQIGQTLFQWPNLQIC